MCKGSFWMLMGRLAVWVREGIEEMMVMPVIVLWREREREREREI